jgi:hypothetical protein
MSIFTIYNPKTKEIFEEKEFKSYIDADNYVKNNYASSDVIAKHNPFNFNNDFRNMLIEFEHPRIKLNKYGEKAAIIDDDGETLLVCGSLTLGEYMLLKNSGIKMKSISKTDFIKKHNSLFK